MKSLLLLTLVSALAGLAFATGPHSHDPPDTPEVFDSLVMDAVQDYTQPETVLTAPAFEFEISPVEIGSAAVVIVQTEFEFRNVGVAPYNPVTGFIVGNTGKAIFVRHSHPPDFDGFHRCSTLVTRADWTAFTDDGFRRARDAL